MRNKLYYLTFFLLAVFHISLTSQSFPDSEFDWVSFDSCLTKRDGMAVFSKVEKDPILLHYSREEFKDLLKNLVDKLSLNQEESGLLKFKMLFGSEGHFCFRDLGAMGMEIDGNEVYDLKKNLDLIDEITPGRQREKAVDCIGILYLKIKNGKLLTLRNVNFEFRND